MDARRQMADGMLGFGDNTGALAAYEQSLVLARRLAEADAGKTNYLTHVSALLVSLASITLGAANPPPPERRRDWSTDPEKIAKMKLDAGDSAGALALYEESLVIRRRLFEA